MKNKEDLIYDLIFSENTDYRIDISEYDNGDIYKYDKFINEIKKILKKSKVSLIKENVDLDIKSVVWNIKVKR